MLDEELLILNDALCDFTHDNIENFSSVEQLWLGLVMESNYNKSWSGSDWISIGN